MKCKSCSHNIDGRYCGNCGQKVIDHHSFKEFYNSLKDSFGISSGILLTFFSILFRPGKLTIEYLSGATKKYTPPLTLFLISLSLLYFFTEFGVIKAGFDEKREFLTVARALLTSILISLLLSKLKFFKRQAPELLIIAMWFETIRIIVFLITALYLDVLWRFEYFDIYFWDSNFPIFVFISFPLLYFSLSRKVHLVVLF